MHLTRRELLDDFLAFVGETGDSNARDVGERLLNRSLTSVWLRHPWRAYRSPAPVQVTCVANQRSYALPDYFGRLGPGTVRNLTTGAQLEVLPDGDTERLFPTAGTTLESAGVPTMVEIAGVCGVHTQPASTGDALEVVSDNAADTDVVVAIAGNDSSGRWTRNQVTLTGTVAVAIGTWSFVDELAKAYLATVTPATELSSSRGMVTLRKVAGATELQKLFAQESAKEHQLVTLYAKPASAYVIAIPTIRKVKRLVYDADAIPDLWEPAVWEAMHIEWMVNTGEMRRENVGQVRRPALEDLIAFDNETTRAGGMRTTPFGGM